MPNVPIAIVMNITKNILTVIVMELTWLIIYTGLLLSSFMKMLLVKAMLIVWEVLLD